MEIICSIGPRVNNPTALQELYNAGMTMMRFNFSHANYPQIRELIFYGRRHFPAVQVVQDLQGAKLRVGHGLTEELRVGKGDVVVFCEEQSYRQWRAIAEQYKRDSQEPLFVVPVRMEGDFSALTTARAIYMKDATMRFAIQHAVPKAIKTVVERGGVIRAEKGINAPGMDRSNFGMTKKDRTDIDWGVDHEVSVICYSYASHAQDVKEFRSYVTETARAKGKAMPRLWAKIECQEGIDNFDEIVNYVDGIMLGRGDLLAEVNMFEIPKIQQSLLQKMRRYRSKEFIIATYLLESMKRGSDPTVSELNDIYNCIVSGVDGFMLSGEIAVGQNPVSVIDTLKALIERHVG